jgi:hypothetical protein
VMEKDDDDDDGIDDDDDDDKSGQSKWAEKCVCVFRDQRENVCK